jgi:hypothetical protein
MQIAISDYKVSCSPPDSWEMQSCCLTSMSAVLYSFIAFACALSVLAVLRQRRRVSILPPGPPGDPLVGHLLRMPPTDSALVFHQWSKTYGAFSSNNPLLQRSKSCGLTRPPRRGDAPEGPRTIDDNPRHMSGCRGPARQKGPDLQRQTKVYSVRTVSSSNSFPPR